MESRRRVRPAIIVAGCLLAVAAAVIAVLWRQGDFWRASAANYLRERLAADFDADFQTSELRGRWFPPGISLGRVTLHPPEEAWVLTAEDVRVTFNLYAVIFGRERLGSVVLDRPRLFVRERVRPGKERVALPARSGEKAVADAVQRLRTFLRPPFPLRLLEVGEGRVEVLGRDGARSVATGVELSVLVSSGSARAVLSIGELSLERRGRRMELGRIEGAFVLEGERAVVRELSVARGPVSGAVSGTVEYAGTLALKGRLTAGIEQLAALAGHAGAATGKARFEGRVTGAWRDPTAAGTLLVRDLAVQGRRWPETRARVSWGGGRLAWSELTLPLGEGALSASGEVDFSPGGPHYRVEAEARDVDLSRLPGIAGPVSQARRLRGTARWGGSGLGAAASGGGRLSVTFALEPAPGEEIALEADAALGRGALTIGAYRVAARSLEASGSGSWSRAAGFTGRVSGSVADLRRLLPEAKVALGGKASFAGDLGLAPEGPSFAGELRLAGVAVGPVSGIEAAAGLVVDARTVRIADAKFAWPGVRGVAAGAIEVPSGRMEIAASVERLELREASLLFVADPALLSGSLGGRLRVRGTLREPEVEGSLTGENLSYRRTVVDEASLSFAYAAHRMAVTSLRARRGASRLAFRGEVREGGELAGEFEIPGFELADFVPVPGFELAGALRGRLSGSVREPQIDGRLSASRLRYRGFDFKGGEAEVDYREGKIGLAGWLVVPENRLRMVLEPAQDWRFEADLALRQLAPEIVRSGAGALPASARRLLGSGAFLAAGRLDVSGRLREAASIRARLHLDTLWLQAAGKTLQNRTPVRLSWREGGLAVESFSLAGEQYHLDVSGGGSPASGWSLKAGGAVDLALLRDFWPELEEVAGTGELLLTLGGPWSDPLPEGTLVIRDAFVRASPMPEPVEHLEARITLRGRTVSAAGVSGTIGGGAFRGRGAYDMAADRLEADVEGRLDLAFFRARLPAARDLRGPLEVSLHLAGPIASPRISGEIEVVDAELFVRPFPAKFTHLRGRVTLGADRLEIRDLRAQTGGGTMRLTGSLDWSRAPLRVDAELEGSGILLSLAGALKAQNDLHLRLQGDLRDLRLSGEVRILKARYLREFGEKPPSLVAAGSPAGGSDTAADFSRMALDVKVRATDNVWIANRMARIEAAVALDIGGTLGAPIVSGEITGIQGEAFYISRQFRLESGSLRFVPPATIPRLDVQASTTVGETQILFIMEGPLNKPEYHLTSLPGMSQEDLIALLTIGETRSGLERRGESAATAGAAVFTAVPLVTALGDEMRSATGLETLKLEPIVGEGNQVSARVTVGTHLSDRLFVSYSQNLGATEDQQVAVQYHLLDFLSLLGQELRQDVYSLDLVFRYSFR